MKKAVRRFSPEIGNWMPCEMKDLQNGDIAEIDGIRFGVTGEPYQRDDVWFVNVAICEVGSLEDCRNELRSPPKPWFVGDATDPVYVQDMIMRRGKAKEIRIDQSQVPETISLLNAKTDAVVANMTKARMQRFADAMNADTPTIISGSE